MGLVWEHRTWADKVHLAPKHVPELGELVECPPPKNGTHPSRVLRRSGRTGRLGRECPELQESEFASILTNAALAIENGGTVV